jgi:hypothetical protein
MKKLGLLLLPILAITLMLGGNAFAQNVGDDSVYFVTYYSNANTSGAPDGTLRIVNDGDTGGTLYAAIYVFDDSQEMRSCCACAITADGMLSESVNKELTSDEFSGRGQIQRGVIKVVSSSSSNVYAPVGLTGLRGWMTHIQATTNGLPVYPATCIGDCALDTSKGPWFVTETALADSNLSGTEASTLGTLCSFGISIGSGFGSCPCTPEDYDF